MFKLKIITFLRTALYAAAGVMFGISLRALERGDEALGFPLLIMGLACLMFCWRIKDFSKGTQTETKSRMEHDSRTSASSTVVHATGGLEIHIRPYRPGYVVVTFFLWVLFLIVAAIFGFGLISKSQHVHSDSDPLISVLPLLFVCLLIFTWVSLSVEDIRLSTSGFSYSRRLLGLGRTREFALSDIKNMRVTSVSSNPNIVDRHGSPGLFVHAGLIAFDCNNKTYRIASGIHPSEATNLVAEIKKYYQSFEVKHSEERSNGASRTS